MAEAVAKEKVCNACGAEIRPESLFCYGCGGSLEAELAEIEKEDADAASVDAPIEKPSGEIKADKDEEDKKGKVAIKSKSVDVEGDNPNKGDLKTAASLRKKPKNLGNKRVEVVWEEHEGAPNVWFIIGAVIFTILGAVLFYIAMYLK